MSEIDGRYVYCGLWHDTGKSYAMGTTITADTRTGTLVVALLAILCSLSMTHLWHLIAFAIHQTRSNGRSANGLFHQQQAILRTLPTPGTLLIDFAKVHMAWRSCHVRRAWMRSVPIALSAAFFSIAATATGIFSSYVIDTTNLQVLVVSPLCGPIELSKDSYPGYFTNYTPIVANVAQSTVQECYHNTTASSSSFSTRCRTYRKPRVPFTVAREDCPWRESLCLQNDKPSVVIDSGLLDLNDALGLNLDFGDMVKFRKRTACAVLSLENRTTVTPAAGFPGYFRPTLPEEEILILSFGNFRANSTWRNATFSVSLARSNVTDNFGIRIMQSYVHPDWYNSDALNISPDFKRNDADVVFKLVAKNRVMYDHPVDDSVFSAHTRFDVGQDYLNTHITSYFPDFPAAILGCTQQYQYCISDSKCTALNPIQRNPTSSLPGASSVQLAIIEHLVTSAYLFDIARSQTIQATSLMRMNGVINRMSDDQWVTEVVGWESEAWAAIQVAVGDYFIGAKARDPYADSYAKPASTDGERKLCSMFRVRSSGSFVNINVFGLAFVCTFSVLVIALDIVLLRFLIFLSRFRRTRWLGPRIQRWIQSGVLQLQRRAYEATDQGRWERLDKEIPIDAQVSLLSDLSISPQIEKVMSSSTLARANTL